MRVIDELHERSRHRFVGRTAELERIRSVLEDQTSRVVWVFGPGGIGKTTLLEAFEREASGAGRPTVSLDLRSADEPRSAVDGALATLARTAKPPVVLIDSFERSGEFERWMRDALVADLPARSVVVVASRRPPAVEWRTHPIWSLALELMPLRSLSVADAQELLDRLDVAHAERSEAIRLSGGHPLALSLFAQFLSHAVGSRLPADLAGAPDLVGALLGRLVDDVTSDAHRRALEVIALARVTDRSLLRSVMGDDADEAFRFLEAQPYVDRVYDGLCPHDLARDLLEADLRHDPDRYSATNRSIRSFLLEPERLRRAPDRCVKDFIYLHRSSSLLSRYWDWAAFDAAHATPLHPGDSAALAAISLRHGSDEDEACLSYWLDRQPEAFTVVRSPGGDILGMVGLLVLESPTSVDLAADPTIAAIWAHACGARPRRDGEVIGVLRFFDDVEAGQSVSPTFNVLSYRHTRHWLLTKGLSLDYILVRDGAAWAPMMDYIDFRPASDVEVTIGGHRHHVFVHDWREVPADRWLDRMEYLETGGPVPVKMMVAPVLVALGHDEFAAAVRSALRDLARPSRLAGSPLSQSRVVRDRDDSGAATAVERAVREAFESLPDDPRTARARRALARTYLHGAVTQEAAAEVLGMAFSTYRRHLATGVDLLVEQLWRWELYGREG